MTVLFCPKFCFEKFLTFFRATFFLGKRKEVIGNINITEENQKFFQWQRANIGGTYNKHSVTNAVENYFLETIHEEP